MFRLLITKGLTFSLSFFIVFFLIFFIVYRSQGNTVNPHQYDISRKLKQKISYENKKPDNVVKAYFKWFENAMKLDFGFSSIHNSKVTTLIGVKILHSFYLNLLSLFLMFGAGIFLGTLTSLMPEKAGKLIETPLYMIYAIPEFLIGILLLSVFSFHLNVFPSFGLHSPDFQNFGFFMKLMDMLKHLFLPALTLSAASIIFMVRFTKNSITEVIGKQYIFALKTRGIKPLRIVTIHIFKNALFPFISLLGIIIPSLVGGSVIIETLFSYPGIGQLFYESIISRDYPLILAISFVNTLFIYISILLADLMYRYFDPRVRYGQTAT